jgi:hypothetical protein
MAQLKIYQIMCVKTYNTLFTRFSFHESRYIIIAYISYFSRVILRVTLWQLKYLGCNKKILIFPSN